MEKNKWEVLASNILKAELAKRGLKYTDLEKKLSEIGENCHHFNIKQKVPRGSFTFAFLLQCFKAIGVTHFNFSEYFEEEQK